MAKETQMNAYEFIIRNARPLEMARWRYHFENGPMEDVIKALQSYQNLDGGFGHALEPDAWNPASSPIQTWAALEILEELNFKDPNHPIIKSILNYLDSESDFDGHFWFNTVAGNNDFPHAPWWHTRPKLTSFEDYNPTAYLAGFILNYADKASTLYQKGRRIAQEAIDCFNLQFNAMEMHMVACFVHLAHDIVKSHVEGLTGFNSFEFHLNARVKALIDHDLGQWDNAYVCKPSRFITDRTSPYFHANQNAVNAECLYLEKSQTPEGSWEITWQWDDFPDHWPIAKNWWKADLIIHNLLMLKNFSDQS